MPDSLWYAVAVSMCRYPASSAWPVTCGAAELLICQVPNPSSGMRPLSARSRLCVVVRGHSRTLSERLIEYL